MPCSASEIPNDVVRQIFAVFNVTMLSIGRLKLFPWFLGHICSTWRSLFLSMNTEFWQEISIDNLTNYERTIDIVHFFLERDSVAPFSFYVAWDERKSKYHTGQIMEMLAYHSMRWKTAIIHISIQDMWPLMQIKNRIPLLQVLHINTTLLCRRDEDIGYEKLHDIFRNAPSLDTVGVDFLHKWEFDLSNSRAVNVLNGLRDATFFFAAQPQMTKLERLVFGGMYDWIPSHAMPSSTIVLPNLTKLTCGKPDWLQFLKAPSLEGLFIECNNSACSDVLLSFLSRNLNISSLGISHAPASTVIDIVRNAPQIAYLQLTEDRYVLSDTLEELAIPTSPIQEALPPHMQSLHLGGVFFLGDLNSLYHLISSRTDSTVNHCRYKRLQKLEIECSESSVPEITKSISTLCAERGVELDLCIEHVWATCWRGSLYKWE